MLVGHSKSRAAPWETMPGQRSVAFIPKILLSAALCLVPCSLFADFAFEQQCRLQQSQQQSTPQQQAQSQKQTGNPEQVSVTASTPRGIHLTLKDGTIHVVREYRKDGDRVRYYSIERHDWEELPAAMVDWDATAKQNAEIEKASTELVAKVHKQEEGKRMDNVTDIDASLQVGAGAFLPSGEGMFVVEGSSIRILDQVDSAFRTDRKRAIAQVLTPIPVVTGRKNMIIAGAHAKLRLRTTTPEFYLREAPPDPDKVSSVRKSTRAGDTGPDVELIRTKIKGKEREIESITIFFGEQMGTSANSVSVQRWEVAPEVYRFTLSQSLPPGEYVLAELLPDGLNMFVWDFGVD
jgi:hypothetical protein